MDSPIELVIMCKGLSVDDQTVCKGLEEGVENVAKSRRINIMNITFLAELLN